jgi:hypothetical protein
VLLSLSLSLSLALSRSLALPLSLRLSLSLSLSLSVSLPLSVSRASRPAFRQLSPHSSLPCPSPDTRPPSGLHFSLQPFLATLLLIPSSSNHYRQSFLPLHRTSCAIHSFHPVTLFLCANQPTGYVGLLGRLRISTPPTSQLPPPNSPGRSDCGVQVCVEHSISRFSNHTVAASWHPLHPSMLHAASRLTISCCAWCNVGLRRFSLTRSRQVTDSQPLFGPAFCISPRKLSLIFFFPPGTRSHLPFETVSLLVQEVLSVKVSGSDQLRHAIALVSQRRQHTCSPTHSQRSFSPDKHGAGCQHKQSAQA